jgi:hypothetical protein
MSEPNEIEKPNLDWLETAFSTYKVWAGSQYECDRKRTELVNMVHNRMKKIIEAPLKARIKELESDLAAEREKLRGAASRAVEYVFFEGDNDPIDKNGFQAPTISSDGLRAAIMADNSARAALDAEKADK